MSNAKYGKLKRSIIEHYLNFYPKDQNITAIGYLTGDMYGYLKQCDKFNKLSPSQIQTHVAAWVRDPSYDGIGYDLLKDFMGQKRYFGAFDGNLVELAKREFIEAPFSLSKSWYQCEPGKLCFQDGNVDLQGEPDEFAQKLFQTLKDQNDKLFDEYKAVDYTTMPMYDATGAPLHPIAMPLLAPITKDPFEFEGPDFDWNAEEQYLPDYIAKISKVTDAEQDCLDRYMEFLETENNDATRNPDGILIGGAVVDYTHIIKAVYHDVREFEVQLYAAHHHSNAGIFGEIIASEQERINQIYGKLAATTSPAKIVDILTYLYHYTAYIFNHIADDKGQMVFSNGGIPPTTGCDYSALTTFCQNIYNLLTVETTNHGTEFTSVNKKNLLNQVLFSCKKAFYDIHLDVDGPVTSSQKISFSRLSDTQVQMASNGSSHIYKNTIQSYLHPAASTASSGGTEYSMYPSSVMPSMPPLRNCGELIITSALSFMQRGYLEYVKIVDNSAFSTRREYFERAVDGIGCTFDFIIIGTSIGLANGKIYGVKCF